MFRKREHCRQGNFHLFLFGNWSHNHISSAWYRESWMCLFTIYDLQTFISGSRCYKIKSCCPVPLYIQILSRLKFMVAFGDVDNCENFMSHQEGMVIAKKVTQQGSRNNRIHWFGFNPCGEYWRGITSIHTYWYWRRSRNWVTLSIPMAFCGHVSYKRVF